MPNLLMNLLSDRVFSMRMRPTGVDRTTVVTEIMFRPETVGAPDFDPSEITEFVGLVLDQDWEVCERVQLGVASRGFAKGGVYPYADRLISYFNEHYLNLIGEAR